MKPKLASQLRGEYARTLTEVFAFMLASGITVSDLREICSRSIKGASSGARAGSKVEVAGLMTVARVLDEWHRNRRYLDSRAIPKAIPLLGPAPSVEGLCRARRGPRNAAVVAKRLRDLKLVLPCGRGLYKPAGEAALVSKDHPLIRQNTVRAVSCLLETVRRNISEMKRSEPLIERFAEVPDLPCRHLPAFQRFSQMQGSLLLRTINDWLESRRLRKPSKGKDRSTRAGIHVFAFTSSNRRRS